MFSVAAVELFDDIHSFDNFAEGREAGFDVVAGGVVAKVDVDLGGSSVGASVGERDVARSVVLLQRVVRDGDVALLLRNCGVAADAELHPTARHDAKETGVVVVLRADQGVEAVGTVRRPVAMGFDDEVAGSGLDFYAEDLGGGTVRKGESEQKAEQIDHFEQISDFG